MMAKPELMECFDMDAFVDLTTAFTALPPVMASSFADSGAKKLMVDEESSDGSGGDAILGFDPFMLFQLPCSDTYESIDSLFAGDAVIQDALGVDSGIIGMEGVSLWSFEEFPMDSAIF
ncbi:uncharacterized protein [Aegilops tauschii subsp. strangulata]|nr:uncharacterized protein LOC123493800 [Aegilops tauschii subsp. strangulata]